MLDVFYRDSLSFLLRYSTWVLLALWVFVVNLVYFSYVEDFLAIQSTLQSKGIARGVTDIVLVPYISFLGLFATVFMASLASRLFYNEKFSDFSLLYKSISSNYITVVWAKSLYIAIIALLLVGLLACPIFLTGLYFDYDLKRVMVTLLGLWMILVCVGMLSLLWAQIFSQSIIVVLVTMIILVITELMVKIIVEPVWVMPIVSYFSPIAHFNRIATGVLSLSDMMFFLTLFVMLFWLTARNNSNEIF